MHSEFSKFSSPQAARGHWPPNQNPADVLDCVWMAILLWMIIQQQRVFPQSADWCFLFVWFLRRIFHLSWPIILFRVSMSYVVISLQSATFCHVHSLVFVSRDKVAEMPNSHRSSNTTKRSCPCRVRCAGCELNDCCGGVQTSNFSVGDSLELSGIQFTPAKRTRHRQDSFVVSRGRCELGKDY